MTAYLMTEQKHAQLVRIFSDASWHIPEGSPLDRDAQEALAMLKAMNPVEPVGEAEPFRGMSADHTQAVFHRSKVPCGAKLYALGDTA